MPSRDELQLLPRGARVCSCFFDKQSQTAPLARSDWPAKPASARRDRCPRVGSERSEVTLGLAAALAGALMAAGPTGPVPISPAARDAFERGRTAFGRAEYQRAIEILYPMLYPDVLLDSEGEIVQAHRMLGVAYLFENKPDEARREFRKLLELRPDYRFDPLLDPQRVVDFFDGVLAEEKATIAKIEQRRREREKLIQQKRERDAQRLALPPTIVRYERHSFTVNFVPFGAGQFQNGQRRKGWFFLG